MLSPLLPLSVSGLLERLSFEAGREFFLRPESLDGDLGRDLVSNLVSAFSFFLVEAELDADESFLQSEGALLGVPVLR